MKKLIFNRGKSGTKATISISPEDLVAVYRFKGNAGIQLRGDRDVQRLNCGIHDFKKALEEHGVEFIDYTHLPPAPPVDEASSAVEEFVSTLLRKAVREPVKGDGSPLTENVLPETASVDRPEPTDSEKPQG